MELLPCKHLRTKRLFIPDLATDAFALAPDKDEVCQCWCNKTMREIGLDDRHVSHKDCTDPSRACYRPR
jgi:hypothetical protein